MFETNEGRWDRGVRIVLGLTLMALGFGGVVGGTAGLVLGFVGLVPLATGLIGWCPLYTVLGLDTCPDPKPRR